MSTLADEAYQQWVSSISQDQYDLGVTEAFYAGYEACQRVYEEVLADTRRLTREIDVAMFGEEGAAKQASLCDVLKSVEDMARENRALKIGAEYWGRHRSP